MKTGLVVMAVFGASLVVAAGEARAADVVVYETSEAITPPIRTAPLLGTANIQSPLCLAVAALGIGGETCTVTGSGSADLLTGAVNGVLLVVVEGAALPAAFQAPNTNTTDAPEIVVAAAQFRAPGGITPLPLPAGTPEGLRKKLDAFGIPVLLEIGGVVAIDYFNPQLCEAVGTCPLKLSFKGTFRLPFAITRSGDDDDERIEQARRGMPAYYLSDSGKLISVKSDERAIGYPTPRLEVTFTGPPPTP